MAYTRTTTIRLFRSAGLLLAVAVVVAYAIWRSLNYVRGPVIVIFEPANGSTVASSSVIVRGRALRANSLTLDGDTISVDQEGNFSEQLIVFPGVNKLQFAGTDQFGRTTRTELELLGTAVLPTLPTPSPALRLETATTASSGRR